MAQVIEHLFSKHKALSSILIPQKEGGGEERRRGRRGKRQSETQARTLTRNQS
jgi:hypothetical protein